MANIKARRKLSDLYLRGVEVRFNPEGGKTPESGEGYFVDEDGKKIPLKADEVQLWVQSPSPLQREDAMRNAQASRARALIRAKREKDSEEHLTIMAFLADMDDPTLVEYVLMQNQRERRDEAMREVLAEEDWKDMTAYQDAIRQFEEDPRDLAELEADPEYQAMMELDELFGNDVRKQEDELYRAEKQSLEMRSREDLERKALEKRAEIVGTQAFMAEYERQMLFYSVREFEDHGVLFYSSARELAEQDDKIRQALEDAMVPFISDVAEAKNSQGAASGSNSSEPPSEPVTSGVSTPEVATA